MKALARHLTVLTDWRFQGAPLSKCGSSQSSNGDTIPVDCVCKIANANAEGGAWREYSGMIIKRRGSPADACQSAHCHAAWIPDLARLTGEVRRVRGDEKRVCELAHRR